MKEKADILIQAHLNPAWEASFLSQHPLRGPQAKFIAAFEYPSSFISHQWSGHSPILY